MATGPVTEPGTDAVTFTDPADPEAEHEERSAGAPAIARPKAQAEG